MSAQSPAFQFYPADFLADENVALMSLAGRGAYITLMCYCWREGSIPADTNRLGRLCGIDSSAMAQLWEELSPCFELTNNRYQHPRLERERRKQLEHSQERRESGRRGALSRWKGNGGEGNEGNKEVKPDSSAIAQPLGEPMANDAFSFTSSTSTSTSEKEEEASRSQRSRSRAPKVCDEDWLKELQAKPAYQALNVALCYSKMVTWCEVKGKQATRSRFINWLNREEAPMSATSITSSNGTGHNHFNGYGNNSSKTNGVAVSNRGADSSESQFQAKRRI